ALIEIGSNDGDDENASARGGVGLLDVCSLRPIAADNSDAKTRWFSSGTNARRRSGSFDRARAIHARSASRRPVEASRPVIAGPQLGDGERAHRQRPGCANPVSPEPGDGSWSNEGAKLRGAHAAGLLCGVAQRLLRSTGRQGRLRETAELAYQDATPLAGFSAQSLRLFIDAARKMAVRRAN